MESRQNQIYSYFTDASRVARYIENDITLFLENSARQTDYELQEELLKKLVDNYAVLARKLKETLAEVERLSITDKLTGIYNRLKFDQELEWELKRSRRYKNKLSLLLFDIDHFKKVNDECGHDAGDSVIAATAALVANAIRASDIFARWGGEEFVILLTETSIDNARILAEKLREKIARNIFPGNIRITCSFGGSEYRGSGGADALFKKADRALYEAKNAGRNCVRTYR